MEMTSMGHPEDDNDKDVNRSWWDRRKFGKILAAAAGGLAAGRFAWAADGPAVCKKQNWEKDFARPHLYPNGEQIPSNNSGGKPAVFQDVDVVVVGAGLSGLIAARELKNANKKVVVLEARERIGGRMYGRETIAGGWTDYGGQWVGPTQYHMQELVSELGITPFLSYEEGRGIQSWDGTLSGFDGDVSNLLKGCSPPLPSQYPGFPVLKSCRPPHPDLPDCVHNEANGAIWNALLAISQTVPPNRPWDTPNAPDLDGMTFRTWLNEQLDKQGVVERDYKNWLSTLQSRIGGAGAFEPDEVSLLHMAWTQQVGPQSDTPEKWLLIGGAGQIPNRLAADLKNCIVVNAPVGSISRDPKGVRVQMDGEYEIWTVAAKAVIIAIPPPLRSRINFEYYTEMDDAYLTFGAHSPMGSMAKVHAVYDNAFWRTDCLNGSAAGNLGRSAGEFGSAGGKLKVCEFIADSSPHDGTPGILTAFIPSGLNRKYPTQIAVQPLVLDDFAYFFGPQARNIKDFVYFNWSDELWTCGAFTTHLGPGVWTNYGKVGWREPVNNQIFWAGTETSDEWPGYFDGAVKAGKRAAGEVLKQ
jgi:monoamine oxidase